MIDDNHHHWHRLQQQKAKAAQGLNGPEHSPKGSEQKLGKVQDTKEQTQLDQ
jgi:hypothetical protein